MPRVPAGKGGALAHDINGDGFRDLRIRVAQNSAAYVLGSAKGLDQTSPAVGDFDGDVAIGDGERDVAIGDDGGRNDEPGHGTEARHVDQSFGVYYGGAQSEPQHVRIPGLTGRLVAADTDGDGRSELAVNQAAEEGEKRGQKHSEEGGEKGGTTLLTLARTKVERRTHVTRTVPTRVDGSDWPGAPAASRMWTRRAPEAGRAGCIAGRTRPGRAPRTPRRPGCTGRRTPPGDTPEVGSAPPGPLRGCHRSAAMPGHSPRAGL